MTSEAHDEIMKFFQKSTQERIEHETAVEDAIVEMRLRNAEFKMENDRDLAREYRNYIIPV
jgi:hypothetical protein